MLFKLFFIDQTQNLSRLFTQAIVSNSYHKPVLPQQGPATKQVTDEQRKRATYWGIHLNLLGCWRLAYFADWRGTNFSKVNHSDVLSYSINDSILITPILCCCRLYVDDTVLQNSPSYFFTKIFSKKKLRGSAQISAHHQQSSAQI